MKFKLLEGQHVQGGHWLDGKRIKGTKYNRGDVFESTTDLMVLNNGARRPKFERLPDDAPLVKAEPKPSQTQQQKPPPPNVPKPSFAALEAMNVKQLQDHAAAEEIELGQAKTKEEMLKIIKAAS